MPAEQLGVAEQPVDALAPDAPVSPPGQSARSASAAWIKSASLSNGHALIGYSQEGAAAWGHSADWSLSSPTWEAHRWDDPPPFQWPPPENFCALYDCGLGAAWATYDTTAQVLWTGLDDVAVAVATGGPTLDPNADVVLLSSTDGGRTFTQAQILSVPTPTGDAGGALVENTVHASLMYTPERTNAKAGTTSIPVYVVWKNRSPEAPSWWMTKAIVGIDGSIAQLTFPVRVSVIPSSAAAHASILAVQDDKLREHVMLAWSERTDASGTPSPASPCPSTQTLHVRWFSSDTVDFGEHWACGPGAGGVCPTPDRDLIDDDPAWRPCVGPSFSEDAAAPPFLVNNDRPELVMTRGLPYRWYAAINRSVPGESGMRAVVWRKRPVANWNRVYVAPSADPVKGALIADAWGQSIAISQGSSAQPAIVAATWRNADLSGRVAMAAASSILFGDLGSWVTTALTSGAGVPWEAAGDMGLHTGTAALQVCIHGACPGAPAAYPEIPFFSAWADDRSAGANPEIWAKAFTP